ncbi:MAG: hypothetical protein KAH44_05745, partial [Oricola sp.]|nr:hypothetical protein [Oricola sp.]
LPACDGEPHLVFNFARRLDVETSDGTVPALRGIAACVRRHQDKLIFDIGPRTMPPDWAPGSDMVIKALERNHLSLDELRAKNFLYKLFNWSVQVRQLSLGQSFMHASAFTKDGCTIGVLGEGGVGKTSAMLSLCRNGGWRYLSDDLAVIDEAGIVYRSPAHLQVYAYNTEGDPDLEARVLSGRSMFDRVQWNARRTLLGKSAVRRRMSAEALFGSANVAQSAPLTNLIFLQRSGNADPIVRHITAKEAAAHMAPIITKEIRPYEQAYAALGGDELLHLESPEGVEQQTREILEMAFAKATPQLISVPREMRPPELAALILKAVEPPKNRIGRAS